MTCKNTLLFEQDLGSYLTLVCGASADARHKGFNLFNQCITLLLPCYSRRSNRDLPPALLAHGGYSYQLCTITSSIHGCVWPRMQKPVRESAIITFKNRCAHCAKTGMITRWKQREKIFKSQGRLACSISQSARRVMRQRGTFKTVKTRKERKKEKWFEIAGIITSCSGITKTAAQCVPSTIWWRKYNTKVYLKMDKTCKDTSNTYLIKKPKNLFSFHGDF